jgi:hypothetical protein
VNPAPQNGSCRDETLLITDQATESVSVRVRTRRRSPRSAMSIKEIAKRAGVSTATVSRAINRIPTVDPGLARRVWKIVDELGYYPDRQARALVSGQSRIFGLIVPELTNPVAFFGHFERYGDVSPTTHHPYCVLNSASSIRARNAEAKSRNSWEYLCRSAGRGSDRNSGVPL